MARRPRRRPGACCGPYRRADAQRVVARSAVANEAWLAKWEPTPPRRLGRPQLAGRVPAGAQRTAAGRPARQGDAVRRVPARRRRRRAAGRAGHARQHRAAGVLLGVRRILGRLPRRRPGHDPDRAGARGRPRLRRRRPAPHRGQHPAGERAPAGGSWRSSASARRPTTTGTCTSTAPGATTSATP